MTTTGRSDSDSPSPRTILAIECSTPAASVAIHRESGEPVELPVATGDRSRDHLPPTVDRLLRDAGVDRRRLEGVVVSEGPGGFTGLRVSVAFAKGVAEALGIPTLGVSSAAVAAAGTLADDDPRDALVVMATKRGTAWIEVVSMDARTRRRISRGGGVADADSARERRDENAVVLADPRQDPEIVATLAADAAGPLVPRFSASALLRIAERTPRSAWSDPTTLAVRYPRVPEAVTKWRTRGGDR